MGTRALRPRGLKWKAYEKNWTYGCVVCALFSGAGAAWNDTGHMTVAEIAYRQLDDAQKQKVADILKQHPHYQLLLHAHVPEGVDADEWAFLKAATWPDFVRPIARGHAGRTI